MMACGGWAGQGLAAAPGGGAQKALVLQILRPGIWAQDPSPVPVCAHQPLSLRLCSPGQGLCTAWALPAAWGQI